MEGTRIFPHVPLYIEIEDRFIEGTVILNTLTHENKQRMVGCHPGWRDKNVGAHLRSR